eukprot:6319931-Lingulodinium_polyedra.AAC.1
MAAPSSCIARISVAILGSREHHQPTLMPCCAPLLISFVPAVSDMSAVSGENQRKRKLSRQSVGMVVE